VLKSSMSSIVKLRFVILILTAIGVFVISIFFAIRVFRPKKASLLIQTNPEAKVIINNLEVGTTPYEAELTDKQIILKLESGTLIPYEAKVKLVAGVTTVVRRNFGPNRESSSGEVISFEKKGGKEANVSVISTPQAAQVFLDGAFYDFSPTKLVNVALGEHELRVSAIGYLERSFLINTEGGYNLTAIVELASDPEYLKEEVLGEADINEEEALGTWIKIKETPTGFLRVREQASTGSREVAKVVPGEQFILIEESEDGSWYKIKKGDKELGWILGDYAKRLDESDTPIEDPDNHSDPNNN